MDSKQQLRILWSSRWWLLLLAVLAAATAYLTSASRPEVYRAEALAQVIPAQQVDGISLSTDQLLQATNFYAELARTTPVVTAAQRVGKFDAPIADNVDVQAQPDLLVLEFTGDAGDPQTAARYANSYARAFASEVAGLEESERRRLLDAPQQRLSEIGDALEEAVAGSSEATALETERQALQARLADVVLSPTDQVRIIQPAIAPDAAASPKPVRDAVLAFIAALIVGCGFALLRHGLTDRYASIEEAALDLRLPILGELPKSPPAEPEALEAFRKLRAQIEFGLSLDPRSDESRARVRPGGGDEQHNVLLVTSPEAASGKTYVSSGLSRALAADGRRVVAVDGDLRRPTLHTALGLPQAPGLGELLTSGRADDLDLSMYTVGLPDGARRRGGLLEAVPAGRLAEDTAERLSSGTMTRVVDELVRDYEFVVADSPPVLAIVDAVVLTRYADGVIVVVDARRSRRRNIRQAVETLRAVQAPILGVVFNRTRTRPRDYGYYGSAPAELGEQAELTR